MNINVNVLKLIGAIMLMVALGSQATSARTQQTTPTLQSTAQSAPPCDDAEATTTPHPCPMLEPGDSIGGMRLDVLSDSESFMTTPSLYNICQFLNCSIPLLPRLAIGPLSVRSDGQPLDADWSGVSWELYLDGHPIDLKAFGAVDFAYIFTNYSSRAWKVVLENPTPGLHLLHIVRRLSTSSTPLPSQGSGFDYTYRLTIQEAPCPPLPKTSSTGQVALHPTQDTSHASFLGVGIDIGNCGVRVTEAISGSEAYKKELQKDDLIRAVDGVPIVTLYQLRSAIGNHNPGDRVALIVERNGEQIEVHATLTAWPSNVEIPGP